MTNLFKNWGIHSGKHAILLGLSSTIEDVNSKEIIDLIKGSRDAKDRIALFLRIYATLKHCFPADSETRSKWIHQPNRAFRYRSPLALISEQGFTGLLIIDSYLNKQMNR